MSVTNLTNTKWIIASKPDVSTSASYNLDFQTNGEQGSKINIKATGILAFRGLNYALSTDSSLLPVEVQVYDPTNYEWYDTDYRTIIITGGADVENANLIAWLEANATQDTSFPGEVSCYYKNNWIGGFSSSGSYKFDTAGTWLEDDITINYSRPSGGSTTVLPLSVTSNGTYTASSGTAYSPVTVNVSGGATSFIENLNTFSSYTDSEASRIADYVFAMCSTNLTTVSFASCLEIGRYAFSSCYKLSSVYFPECQTVGYGAFAGCASLASSYFPKCSYVSEAAFRGCRNMLTASFPSCVSVDGYAFCDCYSLQTISFPICTTISGIAAFGSCRSLSYADFPSCTAIGSLAFASCSGLTSVSFPLCSYIYRSAFYSCTKIQAMSFPICKTIESYTFANCTSLTTISLPICEKIGSSAFYSCYEIQTMSFPSCTTIGSGAFTRCRKLIELRLEGSSVAKLEYSTAFSSTPIAGYTTSTGGVYGSIYVPSSLYSIYISSTNWRYFSSRFVSV